MLFYFYRVLILDIWKGTMSWSLLESNFQCLTISPDFRSFRKKYNPIGSQNWLRRLLVEFTD